MVRPYIFALLSLLHIAISLDCRKFSFAPACRGIMLKRSGFPIVEVDSTDDLYQTSTNLRVLSWLLRKADSEGIKECLPISWVKQKFYIPVMQNMVHEDD